MKLFVCEKKTVGMALSNALPGAREKDGMFIRRGADIVAWASGHLLELCEPEEYDPAYKKWSRETLLYVPEKWRLRVKKRGKELFASLSKAIKGLDANKDTIVNVGDADREGQLLIDEILDYCGWRGKTLRLRLNDINRNAIRKALENMRDNSEYLGEYRAGQARMYADWLVGLSISRYVTVSLRDAGYKAGVMSVGRVQTPTLGLVVSRDAQIRDFTPSAYYALTAVLSLDENRTLKGNRIPKDTDSPGPGEQKRITDRAFTNSLVRKLDGVTGVVTSVTKEEHGVSPPLPYSLPKLQMAASKKYDITDALVHVQKLYESGCVTYSRTSCEYIPEGHFSEAPDIVAAIRSGCPSLSDMLDGADFTRKSAAWDDEKISEHHAIIPTARVPFENALSGTERKIYELICARYALQFIGDYEYEETAVTFGTEGETFKAAGRTTKKLGWQGWEKSDEALGKGKKETDEAEENEGGGGQILPAVRQGETGNLLVSCEERETKPPKPYTYHSLLAAMNGIHAYVKDPNIKAKLRELQGIGTSATQEGIVSTLFERGYIEKRKKQVVSTDLGKLLIDLLTGNGESKSAVLVYPDMTALWEQKMGDIEGGGVSLDSFVEEVADMVRDIMADDLRVPLDIPGLERRNEPDGETVEAQCPLNCGANARRFSGKYGFYWKCACSPDVIFKDIDGTPAVKESRVEAPCPAKGCSGKAVRLQSKKDGRAFWKCRKCGAFFDDAEGKPKTREAKK
jgi:DNA topoisomerase-3